jgi:hypothetical protein
VSIRRILLIVAAVAIAAALTPEHPSSQQTGTADNPSFACGSDVTPEEAQRYLEFLKSAPDFLSPEALLMSPPYCVPIAGHIVRRSDGTGGMSLSQYNQSIDDANYYYTGMDIVFYSLTVDYIDSDFYYYNITTIGDINALRGENVVPDAINVYYTPNLPGLCGISSFTHSSVQGIVMANDCSGVPWDRTTMPHEIGHYFNLYHTHETAFGAEYVDGSNCGSAGDLLCDTPADPLLGYHNVNGACVYTGTETDGHGDPYTPDPSQIMSYAPNACQNTFSPLSETRAVNVLVNLRPELLSRGCSAIPQAVITDIEPAEGFADQTLDVVIIGDKLRPFTWVLFTGSGITVNTADTLSTDDSLLVNITIDVDATPDLRSISVNNGLGADSLSGAFEVLATPRHYVSAVGGDIYPYGRPADAANDMADAVAAAAGGDSVLVDTTTVVNVAFNLITPLVMSGGWTDGFTSRDLASKKTTLDLTGNILLAASTGSCSLDGFVLQNGHGEPDILPRNGDYGGAVRIVGCTASVTNCEICLNEANDGIGFGGGGGIYATDASVTIASNHFHDNNATYGGAIYLYDASGSVTDNTIENNALNVSGADYPMGGGIALEDCDGVTLSGNTIIGNTGARNGGAIWISGSTNVTIDGGAVSGHTASNYGGGVYAGGSDVELSGIAFDGNIATFTGGAVAADDTSSVTVSGCVFDENSAMIGAGVYATTGQAFIRHNLFIENTASFTGGAVYVASLAGGEVIGNTADRNTGVSGTGGLHIVDSPIDALNNIVTNSTGHGVACSGSLPSLGYNLVWGSSGDDYNGCAAGAGSASADPAFADTAAVDYHLTLASPAIDAGDPAPAYDDPDGSRGDMGWYGSHAFTMDQPSYPKDLASQTSGGDLTLTWSKNPEASVSHYAVFCDTTSGFRPSAGNLITTTPDTSTTLPAPADTSYCVVCAVDSNGYASGYSVKVMSEPNTGTAAGEVARYEYRLDQNVPNPFNPTTAISYSLADRARVTIQIYDVGGRLVRTLVDEENPAGSYKVTWDGANNAGQMVSSGIYFYRLEAGAFVRTRKMVLLK